MLLDCKEIVVVLLRLLTNVAWLSLYRSAGRHMILTKLAAASEQPIHI